MLGPKEPCIFCHERKCFRHQSGCDRCNKFCWICSSTKADENCGRCQRAAKKLLASGVASTSSTKYLRLSAIVNSTEALTCKDADKLLKNSGLNEKLIKNAAGGGAAGTAAYKRVAVAWASRLEREAQKGGDVRKLFATYKARGATSQSQRPGPPPPMSVPVAAQAVADLGEKRLVEPFSRDAPAVALAAVNELFLEASNGVTDPLVVAGLNRSKDYVQAEIVSKVRNPHTHRHGWKQSNVEWLEGFARREAKKAIKQVLGHSRAAVEERRAKEPPKKKRTRAKLVKSAAKVKKAKADRTYKNPRTGDTKNHFNGDRSRRDKARRLKLAFNKVEKYGPDACRPDEVRKHAEHKAHLEACAARYAARKGKK